VVCGLWGVRRPEDMEHRIPGPAPSCDRGDSPPARLFIRSQTTKDVLKGGIVAERAVRYRGWGPRGSRPAGQRGPRRCQARAGETNAPILGARRSNLWAIRAITYHKANVVGYDVTSCAGQAWQLIRSVKRGAAVLDRSIEVRAAACEELSRGARMRFRITAAAAMTVLTASAHPQGTREGATPDDTTNVLPGDERLDAHRLLPHRVTWRVTVHDSAGGSIVQGLWTDIWARSEEDGKPVAVFRQLYVDTTGAILVDNETVFDAGSFRALRSSQSLPPAGSRVAYRYEEESVTGTLHPAAGAEARDFQIFFDQPVWEPLAPLLVVFPLERVSRGAVIRYPIWNQTTSGDDVTWNVARVDSVGSTRSEAGRTVKTWHLTMRTAALPNVVIYLRRTPEPPFTWWLRVERPGLTREWTLVDWEPLATRP